MESHEICYPHLGVNPTPGSRWPTPDKLNGIFVDFFFFVSESLCLGVLYFFSYWSLAFILCFLILCFYGLCVYWGSFWFWLFVCLFNCFLKGELKGLELGGWRGGGWSARSWGKGSHDQNIFYGGNFSIEKSKNNKNLELNFTLQRTEGDMFFGFDTSASSKCSTTPLRLSVVFALTIGTHFVV